jgi:hypothetical protein
VSFSLSDHRLYLRRPSHVYRLSEHLVLPAVTTDVGD